MRDLITMSTKELTRLEVMQRLGSKHLNQAKAAQLLKLSKRQIKRLYATYKAQGAAGLISRKRGKPSNNSLPEALKQAALGLIRTEYYDFGPTLACEKLNEVHHFNISLGSVRRLMISAGIWETRSKKKRRVCQLRSRREAYGELIQIDGSEHDWFEGRAPICTLLVYIDDATGKLMELRFVASECTFGYFGATRNYLINHGRPVAFYSDRHAVFRVNKRDAIQGDGMTQFGRAMDDLNIDVICANSSEAKGRVERANQTLQDRLVKELRLRKISSISKANTYLPKFIKRFNEKFSVLSKSPINAHRPLPGKENLDEIFTWQEERTLSHSLTIQYNKTLYIIEPDNNPDKMRRARIKIFEYENGKIVIKYKNKILNYRVFDKQPFVSQAAIVENKRLGNVLKFIQEQQKMFPRTRILRANSKRKAVLESAALNDQ